MVSSPLETLNEASSNAKTHAEADPNFPHPNKFGSVVAGVTSLLPDRGAHNLGRLGAHPHPQGGLDVVVAAPHAKAVEFCVQASSVAPETRYRLFGPIQGCWHGYFANLTAGTRYGFRAYGAWDVDAGLFYNPAKLLLDPYGRGVSGSPQLSEALYAHQVDESLHPLYPLSKSPLDSKYANAWSVVTSTNRFLIAPPPRTPWEQTIIYEMHVVGFTKRMPGIPEELRGTYAGLAHPVAIEYLRDLGVSAVELLPIHAKMSESFLTTRNLENYWGYSTLSYFAPEPSYATMASQKAGAQAVVDEFRSMVSELHKAGIEVLLDVVYNHTCEGGNPGITVSWRGLDPLLYYRHTHTYPHTLLDDTGCGNTLNSTHPRVVQMILDSLRYWVQEMGVDGFRFDLATALGRLENGFTPFHPLFVGIAQDPVLQNVKMIAEPWDVGLGGWQTSGFPSQFSEWNDRYRDALRRFWLTDYAALTKHLPSGNAADLATRLSGSADMFWRPEMGRNRPWASINFITSHDGFTLADLTRYNEKHNQANLEENRDGTTNNLSWNHGFEGVFDSDKISATRAVNPKGTDANSGLPKKLGATGIESIPTELESVEPESLESVTSKLESVKIESTHRDLNQSLEAEQAQISENRLRTHRNLLASLLISAGTPMIVAGDEFARTQHGNNNAYCQNNEISWLDWNLQTEQEDLLYSTKFLLALRRLHPILRPQDFFTGHAKAGGLLPDVSWLNRAGEIIDSHQWHDPVNRVLQMRRSGLDSHSANALVVINGANETAQVSLGSAPSQHWWSLVFDSAWQNLIAGGITSAETAIEEGAHFSGGTNVSVEAFSLQIYLSTQ